MNNREDNFKEALKTLVTREPEKLAFFDGSDKASIPPFVPRETAEDSRKTVPIKRQRRGYTLGMFAAAACCIVFVCSAMLNYGPESLGPAATGGNSAAQAAPSTAEPEPDDYMSGENAEQIAPESDGYDESLRPGAGADDEKDGAGAGSENDGAGAGGERDGADADGQADFGGETDGADADGQADFGGETDGARAELIVADNDAGTSRESAALPFALLIIGAIVFAVVFLILFVKRRKVS